MWYARYEDLFEVDAANLDDAAKVRLLLRKLSVLEHTKYVNSILPKHPRDHTFKETVEKLTKLFGSQKSLFNMRYHCLQITKDATTDFLTYAGNVNKECEKFQHHKLTLDQFKCLIFIMGLKSPADFEVRTKLLARLDSGEETLTLDKLSAECKRLINLKADTALIENKNETRTVNKVQAKNHNKRFPKTPCWFCGGMHYTSECPFSKHKCKHCNRVGHKEGYCDSGKSYKNQKQTPLHLKRTDKTTKRNRRNQGEGSTINSIFVTNQICVANRKYIRVQTNDFPTDLQFDTASDITIISEDIFRRLNVSNKTKVSNTARSATGKLPLSAQFECTAKFKGKQASATCYVTPIQNLNVMGLDWITALKLDNEPINAICNKINKGSYKNQGSTSISIDKSISLLKKSFPAVFDDELGLCTKAKALTMKPNAQPIFLQKRPVAFAIQGLVEAELQRL
ncbi:uncharacterized protein K02A2.6-like [Rhagoletis pomonella]|uniref:uncharacterized protein K02A2.6-like n=1 Tax=Rhagoletis pomonella TaxID=28610 RepID=UPI001784B69D|nr:uncharacterized protein K02A2.6-like [Rhagoletis pomonella]